jgi:RimJ/RimL family protein N-acetyltransferase
LRPFTPADIPWVYDVSLDPVLQRFMQVPSPYRLEDAASHVLQAYIAGWDDGRRAEFVAEDAATATPLGRVGLRLGEPGAAEVGYWVDPRARKRGVATTAVRAVPLGRLDGGHRTHRVALRSGQHRFSPSRGEGRIPHRGDAA